MNDKMKTPSLHNRREGRPLGRIFATAALLLGGALMAQAQQFNSPAGTWDFVLSGPNQQGIAFVTFLQDSDAGGTFYGYQLLSMPNVQPVPSTDGRNPGGDPGRSPSTTTNAFGTNVFGFMNIHGPWLFDNQGRVQGLFYEVVNSSGPTLNWLGTCITGFVPYTTAQTNGTSLTNTPAVMALSFCLSSTNASTNVTWSATNADGTTNEYLAQINVSAASTIINLLYTDVGPGGITNSATNFVIPTPTNTEPATTALVWIYSTLSGTNITNTSTFTFTGNFNAGPGVGTATNGVSFVGKVVPGTRFNFISSPSLARGKITYLGVPYQTDLPDMSGNWYGTKREGGNSFLEFFNLTSVTQLGASFFTTNGYYIDSVITNFPTIYYGQGMGPGYGLGVFTLISAHKKIGFNFDTVPIGGGTNIVSVTYGPFTRTATGGRAITRGIEEPDSTILFNGTLFNAP
jgi:hypothetical protein